MVFINYPGDEEQQIITRLRTELDKINSFSRKKSDWKMWAEGCRYFTPSDCNWSDCLGDCSFPMSNGWNPCISKDRCPVQGKKKEFFDEHYFDSEDAWI